MIAIQIRPGSDLLCEDCAITINQHYDGTPRQRAGRRPAPFPEIRHRRGRPKACNFPTTRPRRGRSDKFDQLQDGGLIHLLNTRTEWTGARIWTAPTEPVLCFFILYGVGHLINLLFHMFREHGNLEWRQRSCFGVGKQRYRALQFVPTRA